MPFPWMSALKVIPWGQVIEHSPKVLARARDLIKNRQAGGAVRPAPRDPEADAARYDPASLVRRLEQLETDLVVQQQRQEDQVQLLAAMVEQHESLLRAMEALSWRLRALWAVLLVAGLTGLAIRFLG